MIQSEVSQKEKDKYHILAHIQRIQKNGTEEFIYNAAKESEKVGLKLNIQKSKIMAPDPITSWQIDGETMETGYFEGL